MKTLERDETVPARLRPISWGAVLAGAATAVVLWLWLSAAGLAAGLGGAQPSGTDVGGVAKAIGVWTVLAPILALFAGGLIAGRLSGMGRRVDTAFNGVVTWAVTMMAIFALVASGVGAVVGGAFHALGDATRAIGGAARVIAPDDLGLDTGAIGERINETLRSTGKPELQPEQLKGIGVNILKGYLSTSEGADQVASAVDKDAVVAAIAANSDLSRGDAEQIYGNLEGDLKSLEASAKQKLSEVQLQAKQTAAAAAQGASKALWGLVAAMFLALVSTVGGSVLGTSNRKEGLQRRTLVTEQPAPGPRAHLRSDELRREPPLPPVPH